MKKIFATNNPTKYAIVDDDIAEIIKDMKLKFSINNKEYFRSTTKIKLQGIEKKKYLLLHHLVWLLKTGELPSLSIDHRDRDQSNNQFLNLRLASIQQQNQHRGKQKNNTSNYIGVYHYHDKRRNKKYEFDYWLARIHKQDGKNETKCFPYTDEGKIAAVRWRDAKVREYYKEFAVTNFPDENQ